MLVFDMVYHLHVGIMIMARIVIICHNIISILHNIIKLIYIITLNRIGDICYESC